MTKQRMRLLSGWTIGRVDAEVVYAELERIRRHGGLVAERVIAAATPEGHALHPAFEWDDGKAAGEWRLVQARELIRSIAVVIDEEPPRRVYVHVPSPVHQGRYERTEIVVEHVDMFLAAIAEALADLAAAQTRLSDLRRYTAGREDRVAVLALAIEALATARTAVQQLH